MYRSRDERLVYELKFAGAAHLNGIEIIPETPTFTDIFAGANGTYSVTETVAATPEPSSLALMLVGIGLTKAYSDRGADILMKSSGLGALRRPSGQFQKHLSSISCGSPYAVARGYILPIL